MRAETNIIGALAALALAGCLARSEDPQQQHGQRPAPGERAAPVSLISVQHWSTATAGCEGRLDGEPELARAEGAPSLVVALHPDGEIACVDTWAAVREELLDIGGRNLRDEHGSPPPNIQSLELEATAMVDGDPAKGDPSPQPNGPTGSSEQGDPSPQPNAGSVTDPSSKAAGDPSPQPNVPTDGLGLDPEDFDSAKSSSGDMSTSSSSDSSSASASS